MLQVSKGFRGIVLPVRTLLGPTPALAIVCCNPTCSRCLHQEIHKAGEAANYVITRLCSIR